MANNSLNISWRLSFRMIIHALQQYETVERLSLKSFWPENVFWQSPASFKMNSLSMQNARNNFGDFCFIWPVSLVCFLLFVKPYLSSAKVNNSWTNITILAWFCWFCLKSIIKSFHPSPSQFFRPGKSHNWFSSNGSNLIGD